MEILRRFALFIIRPVFSLALFLLVISWVLVSYLGSPAPIKQTLSEAKVYDHFLSAVIDASEKEEAKKNNNNLSTNPNMPQQKEDDFSFSQPEIMKAAEATLTPKFFQTTFESVIDGVYGWLDGTTTQPEFSINISKEKSMFFEEVANAATTRVEALPVCTTIEEAQMSEDPFSATCKPPGFDAVAAKAEFIQKVNGSDSPLKDDVITFDTLQKDSQEPITQKFENVPKVFQLVKKLPIYLALLALFLAGLIILLNSSRIKALKTISRTLIGVGFTLLVSAGLMWFASSKASIQTDNQISADLMNAAKSMTRSIQNTLLFCGGVYITLGVIGKIIIHKHDGPLSDAQKENNINKVLHTKELDDKDAVALGDKPKDPEKIEAEEETKENK